MSYSETITKASLENILNKVLPTPKYGGIYSASWTSSSHSSASARLTNELNLPAGTYVIVIICPYVASGSAMLGLRVNGVVDVKRLLTCPSANIENGAFVVSLDTASTVAVYSEASSAVTYNNIDRAGLYAIQISDANYNTNVADYIIEQGTATPDSYGTWTYRKWNSGVAECWRDISVGSFSPATAVGGFYGRVLGSYLFPSGLFNTTPKAFVNVFSWGTGYFWGQARSVTLSSFQIACWRNDNASSALAGSIYAIGAWK